MLPFVFEKGMGFERYVDYALSVPMYFVYRSGRYIDVAGASFGDFMQGKLAQLPGELPTIDDWSDHVTTLFPEVRMKQFLEMRGADGGRWRRICALPSFWVGLLYDTQAQDAAWDLVKSWSAEDRQELRDVVPGQALDAKFGGGSVRDIAAEAVAISAAGLKRRNRRNAKGQDETIHLAFVEETVANGRTPADDLLERYAGPWQQDIDQVFREYAF
jgi:glutamate--cysteine ligase